MFHSCCHKPEDFLCVSPIMAKCYFIVYIRHNLFIHLSIHWTLGHFHILAFVNNAAMNIGCKSVAFLYINHELSKIVIRK